MKINKTILVPKGTPTVLLTENLSFDSGKLALHCFAKR